MALRPCLIVHEGRSKSRKALTVPDHVPTILSLALMHRAGDKCPILILKSHTYDPQFGFDSIWHEDNDLRTTTLDGLFL